MLLARGARVQVPGKSALILAAQNERVEMVRLLLTADGVDPNAVTPVGLSALLGAATLGWEEIALLLARDPRTTLCHTTANGWSAIQWAAYRDCSTLFQVLIRRPDADLKGRDSHGQSLLHLVVKNTEMTRELLDMGVVDVNAFDVAGQTPLHKAAFAGKMDVVEMLLAEPGIDVNAVALRSGTALHCAIGVGHEDVAVKLMKDPAIKINLRGQHFSSPLSLAIRKNAMKCVRALCARPDLELRGDLARKSAIPPLMIAASLGNKEAVGLLLAHPRMRWHDERYARSPAYESALTNGFTECARLLKKRNFNFIGRLLARKRSAGQCR
jgi:ankyrin repeat protein